MKEEQKNNCVLTILQELGVTPDDILHKARTARSTNIVAYPFVYHILFNSKPWEPLGLSETTFYRRTPEVFNDLGVVKNKPNDKWSKTLLNIASLGQCNKCDNLVSADKMCKKPGGRVTAICVACKNEYNQSYLPTPELKRRRREVDARWYAANKDKALAKGHRYRERLKKATPSWISCEELVDIDFFYLNRPEGYHVDHIIPLSRGGLHVLVNLQYLAAADNLEKNNHICWDDPKVQEVIASIRSIDPNYLIIP